MNLVYLAALLVSFACVLVVDRRFRLFLWRAPRTALAVLAVGLVFFLAWDAAGIALGVFFRAETTFMTGIVLAPELPLEEPVFLLFLCELTMVLFCGAERLLARHAGRTRS
ncbi:lycopene cyclase domain-containing protein [Microbacterium oryzae]|uniref:lycopene cyclase domain-containing protein n=1 Tax=Microbacterium oryzae TaxID=743009 RepID=UPI0025B18B8C|nr:lycopene cyclase domain-containing protein [Microbacterium oryzae]MDN3310086.1 lycopene cyclase domain-containing protein [Microbacterium oryzae]